MTTADKSRVDGFTEVIRHAQEEAREEALAAYTSMVDWWNAVKGTLVGPVLDDAAEALGNAGYEAKAESLNGAGLVLTVSDRNQKSRTLSFTADQTYVYLRAPKGAAGRAAEDGLDKKWDDREVLNSAAVTAEVEKFLRIIGKSLTAKDVTPSA